MYPGWASDRQAGSAAAGTAGAPGLRPATVTNGEKTWTVVGTKRCYTPTKLDVGHKMQVRVSVSPCCCT